MSNFRNQDLFLLCGVVNGTSGPISGFSISYTVDGCAASVTTNASGEYCIRVPCGACVTIAPGPVAGVTVTPPNYVFAPVCSDLFSLNFTATPLVMPVVSVSGTVTSALEPVSGVTINYTVDGIPASTLTSATGMYTLLMPTHSNVVITPVANGATVTPPSITLTNVTTSISGQDFVLMNPMTVGLFRGQPMNATRNAKQLYRT